MAAKMTVNQILDKLKKGVVKILGEADSPPPTLTCLTVDGGSTYNEVYFTENQKFPHGNYTVNYRGGSVGSFGLVQMTGCCGICVSTNGRSYIPKKGLGTFLNEIRIDMARQMGYGIILWTDIMKNEPQRKILAKNGWKDIYKFTNPRTTNEIAISLVKLTE